MTGAEVATLSAAILSLIVSSFIYHAEEIGNGEFARSFAALVHAFSVFVVIVYVLN